MENQTRLIKMCVRCEDWITHETVSRSPFEVEHQIRCGCYKGRYIEYLEVGGFY